MEEVTGLLAMHLLNHIMKKEFTVMVLLRQNSTDGGPRLKNRSAVRADNVGTGPAIPKFGAWNEADPSASAGYTGIFDQVRVDRLGGTTGARRALHNRGSESPAL
ncbi:hypothetical protein EJ110_NYTH55033 [Nymphaea thermarum]|nr:hypothetical protein EJ110_NYTH55033 [Nymphaea thermarum]